MTEYTFEDLSKQTVAQLRKIAVGVEHEALQDPAKMPKEELLAALCQALGIEAGESPEETVQNKEPAAVQEDAATDPPEVSKKEEPTAAQEDAVTEPPKESKKEEPAAEPAPEGAKEEEPPTKKSAEKKKAPAQESTPTESPAVVSKEKGKLKLQIRELKSQRDAALETHDHVLLKSIRRRIRTLKRKVRRIAA